jgi:uncharacterized protein (TIGR02271 family)
VTGRPPVHVLSRDDGWAVLREGDDRAASVHATQAEAASAGREIARKDGTAFLLHARDGRVRDRSHYGDAPGTQEAEEDRTASAGAEPEGPLPGLVGGATEAVGDALGRASGLVGETVGSLGRATGEGRGGDASSEETDETEAVGLDNEMSYAGYVVYDRRGESLGGVETLFLDEGDELEYVGVKAGLPGARSVLVPVRVTTIDEEKRTIDVAADKEHILNGPTFDEDGEITPEFEREVRGHYGLVDATGAAPTGSAAGVPGSGATSFTGISREHGREGEEEIRVQRSEEELRVGTREREAGSVRIRKRVRTDRERLEVPVKREEVHVERVPVSGEAAEAEIGEDEIVVPVAETEVVVSKRPVVKEEVRVRKDVVEGTEVVEEDVRREEVDVEDATEHGRNTQGPA